MHVKKKLTSIHTSIYTGMNTYKYGVLEYMNLYVYLHVYYEYARTQIMVIRYLHTRTPEYIRLLHMIFSSLY